MQELVLANDSITVKLDRWDLTKLIAALLPPPDKSQIEAEALKDKLANPHNEPRKPAQRGLTEIIADLRLEQAKVICDRG